MAFSSLSSFQGFLLVLLAIPTDQAFGLVILESPARSAGLLTGVGIQHKLSNKISSWSKPKLPDHRTLLILRSNKQSALSSTTDADAAAAAVGESRVEDSPTTTASYASTSRWGTFDYLQHWYPVAWKVDMPLGRPTKLTVFDQDYAVVVKQDNDDVLAYIDQCPHRSAALSQGRLTSNGQYLQCTYHGWSFDKDGVCVQIPQSASSSSSNTGMYSSSRNCATAVPAMVHQGMVWLWPGPQPPKPDQVPPTVPEMDSPDFTVSRTVRDFPMIDWSLLLSNIMDPDHGMFAHQVGGFDWYSASKDHPVSVTEEFNDRSGSGGSGGGGWTMTSRVLAVDKLRARDSQKRQSTGTYQAKASKFSKSTSTTPPTATTTFYAPTVVTIGRRDAHNQTKFLTCFWITPTGTGKSRFLSAAVARAPFSLPRWFQHCATNGFLDQDSLLVASQQPHTLRAEWERQKFQIEAGTVSPPGKGGGARQNLYNYQSPTDRSVRLIDSFWDATLSRVPNRLQRLREMYAHGELRSIPPREVVLDREVQHLQICPDSQDAVRNCRRISTFGIVGTATWCVLRASGVLPRPLHSIVVPVVTAASSYVANDIRRRFYYSYTPEMQHRDLQNIPVKTWSDPE